MGWKGRRKGWACGFLGTFGDTLAPQDAAVFPSETSSPKKT